MGLYTIPSNARLVKIPRASLTQAPAALQPALLNLLISSSHLSISRPNKCQSIQHREFWWCVRHKYYGNSLNERPLRHLHKQHRCHLSRRRRKALHHQDRSNVFYHRHPWSNWGWTRFDWDPYRRDEPQQEKGPLQQRMEQLKKRVEADPYTALFGRRLEPFNLLDKHHVSWSAFCRSFLGLDGIKDNEATEAVEKEQSKRSKSKNGCLSSRTVGSAQASEESRQGVKRIEAEGYEFDPISGRMVPKGLQSTDTAGGTKATDTRPSPVVENTTSQDHLGDLEDSAKIRANDRRKKLGDLIDSLGESVDDLPPKSESDRIHPKQPEGASEKRIGRKNESPHIDLFAQEKEEDLDLLRASDVRAPYSLRKTQQELDAGKQSIRKELEAEYESYTDPASDICAEGIRSALKKDVVVEAADAKPDQPVASTLPPRLEDAGTTLAQHSMLEKDKDAIQPFHATSESHMPPASVSSFPAIYRILAFDPSTLQVTTAEMTSSLYSPNEFLYPTDVLSRLRNPAKFLPHFAKMQGDGFEIVSGGDDILVFKKVRHIAEGSSSEVMPADSTQDDPASIQRPSEQVGGLEKNSTIPVVENGQIPTSPSSRTVQRQETVYTGGPPNWSPYPPTSSDHTFPETDRPPKKASVVRKTLRRMLLTGTATAATCYAIGVVVQYFRTGGREGRGIDGFTEFESDRRRSERE